MNNFEVALCDSNEDYILRFASYLMNEFEVGIHIFTTPESFFADDGNYDVTIMTEEFQEICDFGSNKNMGQKYILCEHRDCEKENHIYKYQAVNYILDDISLLRRQSGSCTKKSISNSKLIGVYSPVAHELSLPFAMALAQAYKSAGRVLFLDLEEISIMPSLLGKHCEKNLMDLLYEIDAADVDLNDYAHSFMGFDYIEPFLNPHEISEIDISGWEGLFKQLAVAEYDVIVILFGRTINGFNSILDGLDKLYILGKPGDYFKKSQDLFYEYIARCNSMVATEDVLLPMSAKNLSDNSYQIEELLQGNLGMFAKKIVNANRQSAN
ncbi:hypothetical protein SAMN04487830_107118 [Pseudobutyrivibrio sp. OR37]|uniref:hypothetical protein n=1 Tax=Pseudobutyrivibrio sp. OR37 TaxID=1798186 RepID=UPI0008EA34AF|nr:hypothetical protein [Pseudobutyrivibrio sp. OR37]SFH76429.1 hypothetical protein SAMN04487830_107118 [Pseudobutyrivibrio sp. OR37]